MDDKIKHEVKLWAYAGWTMPFVALAGVFFINTVGTSSAWQYMMIGGFTIFFSVSVFWWWWAIYRIQTLWKVLFNTAEKIIVVRHHIIEIREDLASHEKNHRKIVKTHKTVRECTKDDKNKDE